MTLSVLGSAGQVYHRMPLSWGLSDAFPHDNTEVRDLGRKTPEVKGHCHHVKSREHAVNVTYHCGCWPWAPGWGHACRVSPLWSHSLSPFLHWTLLKEGQTYFYAHFMVGERKAQGPSCHSNQTVLLSLSESCHTILAQEGTKSFRQAGWVLRGKGSLGSPLLLWESSAHRRSFYLWDRVLHRWLPHGFRGSMCFLPALHCFSLFWEKVLDFPLGKHPPHHDGSHGGSFHWHHAPLSMGWTQDSSQATHTSLPPRI